MNLSFASGPLKAQQGLGVGLGWMWGAGGTPPSQTSQFKTGPCNCSC